MGVSGGQWSGRMLTTADHRGGRSVTTGIAASWQHCLKTVFKIYFDFLSRLMIQSRSHGVPTVLRDATFPTFIFFW